MENNALMTAEYYDSREPDRLIGAVYVPKASANACVQMIGKAILRAIGGNCLTAHLLDGSGNLQDMQPVFRSR